MSDCDGNELRHYQIFPHNKYAFFLFFTIVTTDNYKGSITTPLLYLSKKHTFVDGGGRFAQANLQLHLFTS